MQDISKAASDIRKLLFHADAMRVQDKRICSLGDIDRTTGEFDGVVEASSASLSFIANQAIAYAHLPS